MLNIVLASGVYLSQNGNAQLNPISLNVTMGRLPTTPGDVIIDLTLVTNVFINMTQADTTVLLPPTSLTLNNMTLINGSITSYVNLANIVLNNVTISNFNSVFYGAISLSNQYNGTPAPKSSLTLNLCSIKNSVTGPTIGLFEVFQYDLVFSKSFFTNNTGDTLVYGINSNVMFNYSYIHFNRVFYNLFQLDSTTTTIQNCLIINNRMIGIKFMSLILQTAGSINMTNDIIDTNANLYSVLTIQRTNATIQGSVFTSNNINGYLVHGILSNMTMSNSTIQDNTYNQTTTFYFDSSDVIIGQVTFGSASSLYDNSNIQCSKGNITLNNIENTSGSKLIDCDADNQCDIYGGDADEACDMPSPHHKPHDKGLSTGAIVGIVAATLVGVAGIIGLSIIIIRNKQKENYIPI
ncbi:hypothetical protein SAMD00019534_094770 [Acytostelium subglobosum LB1]|uniref:hypothetical protein n=1 Tax=Acytostelium subglobosum LB1 TaxID=1410327 RepID=UPI000644807B|nr:hypothetical protein SAMD00019534_094770 [Acytostelium subglobosum LB1]GAM26302.1 hypothetical protein SAMD00019534_094770 [Acytostelium subglobosum LB1]|eukprot:XP_012750856.1 hypothetical protein SAMD00019534_094770 [Acytostelium subglobosum LB1]